MYKWILSFFLMATGIFAVNVGSCQKSYLILLPFILAAMIISPPIESMCAKLVPVLEPFKRRLGIAVILVIIGLFVSYNQCLRRGITNVLETQNVEITRSGAGDSEKYGPSAVIGDNYAGQGDAADRESTEGRERLAGVSSDERARPDGRIATTVAGSSGAKSATGEKGRPGDAVKGASGNASDQGGRRAPEKRTADDGQSKRTAARSYSAVKSKSGMSSDDRKRTSQRIVAERKSEAHKVDKVDTGISPESAERGKKAVKTADGASYTGEMSNGIPHGTGTMKMPAGEEQAVSAPAKKAAEREKTDAVDLRTFLSPWSYDRRETGFSAIREYTGQWRHGVPVKKGTFIWSDGDRYSGEFIGREKQGYGIYHYRHGTTYQGQWSHDRANGEGEIVWSNGDRYAGEWKDDRREGKGTYVWNSGITYTGQWKNDAMEGRGKISWADGNSYDGEWKNNMRHGKGVYMWKNGDRYSGEFRHNRREGMGTYVWKDGSSYIGEWKNGTRNGEGVLKNNGKTIRGIFQNDRLMQER